MFLVKRWHYHGFKRDMFKTETNIFDIMCKGTDISDLTNIPYVYNNCVFVPN